MPNNRLTITLSAADQEAVLAAIQTLKQKLPFLIDLAPDERRALPKLGDKSRAFVAKALEIAIQNPNFLPRGFDLEEMRRDAALFEALQPILVALTQVQELVDDTALEVGSEAYAAALAVYGYAKADGQGAALDGLTDTLARRFARKSATPPTPSAAK